MFCPNCGTQIPDDSIFCENCGTPLNAQQQDTQQPEQDAQSLSVQQTVFPPQAVPQQSVPQESRQLSGQKDTGKKKKRFRIILAAVLVLVLGFFLIKTIQFISKTGYGEVTDRNGGEPELNGMHIEPQKIYDKDDLSIWATGIDYWEYEGNENYTVYFYIENRSFDSLWLVSEDTKINGIPIDSTAFLTEIVHGKACADWMNDHMFIDLPALRKAGIDRIETISFRIRKEATSPLGFSRGKSSTETMTIRVS